MTRILLTEDYMRGMAAKAVPGAYYHEQAWWVDDDLTPRAAAMVLRLFPELAVTYPLLATKRDELACEVRPFDFATPHGHRLKPKRVDKILKAKGWSLHGYQEIDLGYGVDVLDQHGAAYLAWQMGLGKTLGTCAIIDAWDSNFNLIVCPNSSKSAVWHDALKEFVPWIPTVVLRNPKAQREADIERVLEMLDNDEPVNFVIHYEALALIAGKTKQRMVDGEGWRDCDPHYVADKDAGERTRTTLGDGWRRFGPWDLYVSDEAHRLKNPKAQTTMAAKRIKAVGRLALSGSVIENNLEEMWSVVHWLYPKRYSAKWRTWNDRFLDYIDTPFGKVCLGPRESALPQFRDEIGRFMVYRRSTDELDIPISHERDLLVDLSKGQRRIYNDLVDSLEAVLDDGTTLHVEEGLSLLSKLRQVATGLDLVGEVSDSIKLDIAQELIEDNPDDVFVVFSWYKAGLRALEQRLGPDNVWRIDGDVSHKRRSEIIRAFQRDGQRQVLLATIATLSEAVNLQRGTQVIMIDRSWNPAQNEQAVARVVRQGQKAHVTVTNIIARDTVDELRVQPTLANKEAMRRLILGGR